MPITADAETRDRKKSHALVWLLRVGLLLVLLAPVVLAPVIGVQTTVGPVRFYTRITRPSRWPQGVSYREIALNVSPHKVYVLRLGDWHWWVWVGP